ncbi:MAG TPA: hypothetical protein VMC79_01385 [Rectinemataceae bacterium]|nr:hypothetical protein [Rectinemataceae bacterium]
MSEILSILPLLLVPVVALLFLNLRLSRRLRYPHNLLDIDQRRGFASLLFRTFRSHYDVILDGAIALVLAIALSGLQPLMPRPAVIIDGSRTMLAGYPGQRALDRALQRCLTEPLLASARHYLLVFDPHSRRSRLRSIDPLLRSLAPASVPRGSPSSAPSEATLEATAALADRLLHSYSFFLPDYEALADIRALSRGEVTFVTDHLRFRAQGFRVEETGASPHLAAYPTALRYDRSAQSWLVTLAEEGPGIPLLVSGWDDKASRFVRLDSARYAIESFPGGRRVRLAAPGLYLLSLIAPGGEVDVDLPVSLPPRTRIVGASGPFSERMLSVFPLLERGDHAEVMLVDGLGSVPSGTRAIRTVISTRDGSQLLDPALSGGALIPAGFQEGVDFSLGPSSRADADLVLAYDTLLRGGQSGYAESLPAGSTSLVPAGSAFLAGVGTKFVPLLGSPGRYFTLPAEGAVAIPPPTGARALWFLPLAALAIAKLALWRRFSGKKLFRAE